MLKRMLIAALALTFVFGAQLASAGLLEDIQARGELVAGVKDAAAPWGYVDEASNEIVGFDIEICRYIADKLGVSLRLEPVTSSTRIPMLVQGSIDMLACSMTHKFERDEQIDFSITYFMDGQKILVAADSGITSVADLAGKRVGSAKGSTSEQNIVAVQPDCEVISFEGYPEAFLALQQGKVEAVTTDSTILLGLKMSAENPDDWAIVGDPISAEPYGIGVPENQSDFRDFVNLSLVEMWKSGKYMEIYTKWFGPDSNFAMPFDAWNWQMEVWP